MTDETVDETRDLCTILLPAPGNISITRMQNNALNLGYSPTLYVFCMFLGLLATVVLARGTRASKVE